MKDSITITPADSKDIRGMQEVFYKTWLATYPNEEYGITVEDIEYKFRDVFSERVLKDRAEKIDNPPAGYKTFFAKDDDKVVGLCVAIESENDNRLKAIYILPEYQSNGIGKMLWAEAQKVFNPHKDVFVSVATYNKKAILFYEKLGFVDTGKRFFDEKHRMKSGSIIPEMDMILKK